MRPNGTANKVGGVVLKVITWLLVAFTVCIMIFTVVTVRTVDQSDRSLFGLKMYIVQSDSMKRSENNADMDVHFQAGDIIFSKNVKDPTALQAGDVITFLSTDKNSFGETITHCIREVKKTESGSVEGYVTYGTNTGVNDEALVTPEYILGIYAGKLAGVGNFFVFLKTTPGYILCILIPFLLLICLNLFHVIRLFRRYKREQTEAMQEERREIEEERAENRRMMEELLALKEQLARQEGDTPTAAPASGEPKEEQAETPSDETTDE